MHANTWSHSQPAASHASVYAPVLLVATRVQTVRLVPCLFICFFCCYIGCRLGTSAEERVEHNTILVFVRREASLLFLSISSKASL